MKKFVVTVSEPHPADAALSIQWDVNVTIEDEDHDAAMRAAAKRIKRMHPKARPLFAVCHGTPNMYGIN
jgi:hypothetical protein